MQDVLEFAKNAGFDLLNPELDGRVHRFDRNGKNNAWFIGWQIFATKSGEPYHVAVIGDWKTGEKHEYRSAGKKLSREDQKVIKERILEAQKKAEHDRILKQDEARKYAEKLLKRGRPVFSSPYFDRKKISELHGTVTNIDLETSERVILIPMRDIDGMIWGCQRILADGTKLFCSGQRILGTMHVIGSLDSADTVYVCEGFATAASIRQATGKSVVVAFNAVNLPHVTKAIRQKYLNLKILVCGDNDTAGIEKANEAARLGVGASIFPSEGINDFNDVFVAHGPEAVSAILEPASNNLESGFIPLGFDGKQHYFYVHRSKDIKIISAFSASDLYELMPLEYWETCYGTERGIRYDQAKSDLIDNSNKIGPFDPIRIRGTGVWLDRGRVVVNTGAGGIDSDFFVYVATKNRIPTLLQPLSTGETVHLRNACEALKWREPKSGILLAGWIAIARIAGALPVRPHIWLTGSSGSGKSTVMDRLIRPALGHEYGRLYLQGGSTEAGIRQAIRADSIPIIFDEFESTDENSKQRTAAIIELMRQSWSQTEGHMVKGSANGAANHYALSFAALVSSIRLGLTNDADRSRFSILELESHNNDREHWVMTKKLLSKIDSTYGERLFARQITKIDLITKNYEIISSALAGIVSQRFGQQCGMLLAGWHSLVSDQTITKEAAESLAEDLGIESDIEQGKVTDESECLEWVLDYNRRIYGDVGGERRATVEKSIAQIIDDKFCGELEQLKSIGIIYEEGYLYISSNHGYLRKYLFAGTRWQNCWHQTLARLPNAERVTKSKRFSAHISKSVKIKV